MPIKYLTIKKGPFDPYQVKSSENNTTLKAMDIFKKSKTTLKKNF